MRNLKKKIHDIEQNLQNKQTLKEESLHEAKKIRAEKLPYGYSALRQFIDPETMNIHYNKHYKGYITKLNDALEGKDLGDVSLEEIIRTIERYSKSVRDNAGGAYNHAIFWKMLSPTEMEPKGEILKKINSNFGSLFSFKKKFEEYAKKRFGSGWVWLVLTKRGTLKIMTTANQDNPLMDVIKQGGYPLLGLDLWEHAYYLKYRNKRDEYIKNFWKVVNWDFVDSEYQRITNKGIKESSTVKKILSEQRIANPCSEKDRAVIREMFNNNSELLDLYSDGIKKILSQAFPDKYYGAGEYQKGTSPGIYDLEKPGRSIINYLNTNYSTFCPLLKDLNRVLEVYNKKPIEFEGLSQEEQMFQMRRMLKFISELKERIFDPNSRTFQTIFQILNATSNKGSKTEDIVEKKFKQKFGPENVKKIGALGSKEDMMGIDMKITIDGKEHTAQVKPFDSIQEIEDMFRIEGTANVKKYKTDWMVFVKRGKEFVIFDNKNSQIIDGTYNFPLDSLLYQF
jgi:Fe-Mn family superoxide dismutase